MATNTRCRAELRPFRACWGLRQVDELWHGPNRIDGHIEAPTAESEQHYLWTALQALVSRSALSTHHA
jgi:hypothetical protein